MKLRFEQVEVITEKDRVLITQDDPINGMQSVIVISPYQIGWIKRAMMDIRRQYPEIYGND